MLDAPPTKEFNPVLPSEFPANNFTMPLGALTSPLPVITISPPVSVLIFILLPAFNTMAPLYPVNESTLELEDTGCFSSIFPSVVSIKTGPAE